MRIDCNQSRRVSEADKSKGTPPLQETCLATKKEISSVGVFFFWFYRYAIGSAEELYRFFRGYVNYRMREGDPITKVEGILANLKSIRTKLSENNVPTYTEAELAGRDMISIIASTNGIFAGEDCDMSSFAERREARAYLYEYGDLAGKDILYTTGQIAKKAGLYQIPDLQSLGWKRFNDLGKAVDSIISPLIAVECERN